MIPLATFRELDQYSYWARDQQLPACATLTLEQLLRPIDFYRYLSGRR